MIEAFHGRPRHLQFESRADSLDDLWAKGKALAKPSGGSEYWVICELPPNRRTPAMRHVLNASDVEDGCDACQGFTIYGTEKEALRHLRDRHLVAGINDVSKSVLREFLVPMREARESLKIIHLALDLKKCKDNLLRLCKCAADIQGGLLSDGEFSNPLARLPAALILAFERIVLFMCYLGYHAKYIDKMFNPSPVTQLTSLSIHSLSRNVFLLDRLGRDAERYLHRAQADIVLMLSTGKSPQQGNFFNEVGASYVVGQMMSNLVWSPVTGGMDVAQVYQRYLENIVSIT
jgi:hypothetical protein